jgi:quinohemoprotein ethanol dehydrogenase
MAYNAQTGLVYIPGYEIRGPDAEESQIAHGKLVAFDPIRQVPRWVVTLPITHNGGALATAGNLVFLGDSSGEFTAYAADSGTKVWSVKTGSAVQSIPVTYVVAGEQYVLMPVGLGGGYRLFGRVSDMATLETKRGPARLLAFKLGGTAKMPPIQPNIPAVPEPPAQTATAEQVEQGEDVYHKFFCGKCHSPELDGSGAWSLGGEVPDLRYMPRSAHERFNASVLGGSNLQNGMPGFGTPPGWPLFKTAMTQEEADALHAYIIDVQWKTYKEGPRAYKSPEQIS